MENKFRIEKKGVKVLSKISYDTIDKVFRDIKTLDIMPPFKVRELITNEDVTDEVLKYIKNQGYVFVEKEEVNKNLPQELIKLLSDKPRELFFIYKDKNLKLTNVFYLKSMQGFSNFWKNNYIPFGYMQNFILFISKADDKSPVYIVDYDNYKDLDHKSVLTENISLLINDLKKIKNK